MKNLMYLILICFSNNLLGQHLEDFYKNDVTILKDSLWFKYKLWEEANLQQLGNPKSIYFDSNPRNINFIDFPVLRFKPEAANYDYGLNLISFLEKDSSNVFGFLIKNGSIVGEIMGFKRNNNWRNSISIFSKDNPPYLPYNNLTDQTKKTVFTIAPVGFLWYNQNDSIYVLKGDSKKPIPAEILIKDYVSLETIRKDYSQGEYRKDKENNINYGTIIVGPVRLDSTEGIKKINSKKK
jgi:hypothetical protein